ncbi:MAG TPA: ATP-binding protein [Stenomitos sp.]
MRLPIPSNTQSADQTIPSKWMKGLPLRLVLVVPFVMQIFTVVGLTGYLSFRNSEKAIHDLANGLETEANSRIVQHLNTYLALPDQLNQMNLKAVELGLLDLQNLSKTGQYFWHQMQLFNVGYINYGTQSGQYIGVERLNNGTLHILETPKQKASQATAKQLTTTYATDAQGTRLQPIKTDSTYDHRIEAWYTKAVSANKPIWSPIYQWEDKPEILSISSSYPVYDRTHRLVGVLGIDLILSQINTYLSKAQISPSGRTFIMERNGLLVANSAGVRPYRMVGEKAQRLLAASCQDPLISASANFLSEKFGHLKTIKTDTQLSFTFKNQALLVHVTPWQDKNGLDWLIVGVVPESDFMAQINTNTRTTALVCFAALMVAILVGLKTSMWISQPILRLNRASRAIATGDLEQHIEVSGVVEVSSLAQSFNQMAQQLRESFAVLGQTNRALEQANAELENRVEARTQELLKAKEVADAANRTKSEFLANMSHELRTPLNAILGFTQVLTRDPNLTPMQRENLGIVGRSGEHLLSLINDVLDMSKIEAGRINLHKSVFDLSRLLLNIREMLSLRAHTKGLQLLYEWDATLPQYIEADQKKLRQILLNLIGNAIKFTEIGYVTVRVRCKSASFTPGSQVLLNFAVEDTGPGIAPHELQTLFDPFVQTETGRKTEQGTGLGLAISRKFVHLMGGDIHVDSRVNQGTTFQFEIPVTIGQAEQLPSPPNTRRVVALAPGHPSYRILAVDDRWENRQLLIKLLEPIGFQVREAVNGQEAIALWESWKPHLIWMDMRMPVINGYDAVQHIKSHLQGQATIVIALTASTLEEERTVVLSAGCDDFVRKPFLEHEIFDKIAQYLGVEYIYEDLDEMSANQSSEGTLTPQTLAALPQHWLTQFSAAAAQLDQQLLGHLLSELSVDHSKLRNALQQKVDDFDFELLMTLAQSAATL